MTRSRSLREALRAWALSAAFLLASGCAAGGTGGTPGEAFPSEGRPDPDRTRVVILHDNDTHLHDNHREPVRAYIERVRGSGSSVFLVSAGDILVRHDHLWPGGEGIEWYRREGLRQVAWMNELEYDLMVSGNHELQPHGTATREILESANFPILAANISIETEALPRHPSHHVFELPDGLSIAVVGLSVINFEPPRGLSQAGFAETVDEFLHLGDEHDALILLNHIGIRYDVELANSFPGLAAIIGGHTHSLIPEAIHVNGVLVAQAGGHNHLRDPDNDMFMGLVVLEFEGREFVESCGWVVRIGPDGVRPAGTLRRHAESWDVEAPACPM